MPTSTLIYVDALSTASSTFVFTEATQSYIISLGLVVITLITIKLFLFAVTS